MDNVLELSRTLMILAVHVLSQGPGGSRMVATDIRCIAGKEVLSCGYSCLL